MSNDEPNVALPSDGWNNDLESPVSCKENDEKKQAKLVSVMLKNKMGLNMHYYEGYIADIFFTFITTKIVEDSLCTNFILNNNHTSNYFCFLQKILNICSTLMTGQQGQEVDDITKLPAIADLCKTLKQLLSM